VKSLRWQGAPPPDNDALSHAVAMVLFLVLAGLLGAWIDSVVGSAPIFLLLLGAIGAVGAFASAYYRYEARMADHDADKPWTRAAARRAANGAAEHPPTGLVP